MANLEQWVSDRLHDILGLSDRYVAQFMIGLAQKSSAPQDFVERLQQTGTIDIDQRVTAFAQELYNKVQADDERRHFTPSMSRNFAHSANFFFIFSWSGSKETSSRKTLKSHWATGDWDGTEEQDIHSVGGQWQQWWGVQTRREREEEPR